MKSKNDTRPDLLAVVSAVGPQLFSFLPLGSLINGYVSPLLVCKSFRDNTNLAISAFEILDFSQCPHLRKINDDAVIVLINNIILSLDSRKASLGIVANTKLNAVKQLDFSRCRKIRGNSITHCLCFMPNIQRISVASCSRFDPSETFAFESEDVLPSTQKLEILDMSGCSKINQDQVRRIFSTISGDDILHLDLSGCSTMINDEICGPIDVLRNLESLNLSGAKRLTQFGFGLIAWLRRSTLKKLAVRGCTGITIQDLLHRDALRITDTLIVPPDMVDEDNSYVGRMNSYCFDIGEAIRPLITNISAGIASIRLWRSIFLSESSQRQRQRPLPNVELFGRLEELDIGHIGNSRSNCQGCIATIAWLNGGRLRKINMHGIPNVSIYDINVLHGICGPKLQVFEPDVSVSLPNDAPGISWGRCLRELNLAHCSGLIKGGSVSFLNALPELRVLKLDCLEFNEDGLHEFVSSTKHLLRLSIQQCSTVTCSKLSKALLQNRKKKLIELDARDISMDCPIAQLRQACEGVLRLNNRYTVIGNARICRHACAERWRTGERVSAGSYARRKRSRNGERHRTTNSNSTDSAQSPSRHLCTILSTGFSQKPDTRQQFYTCVTCSINFGRVLCSTCIKKCHVGHETMYACYAEGYCDCCILADCQCLEL